jgi:hypothetical protein
MQSKSHGKAWLLLLALPYIAMLWVPSYNSAEPAWLGFPFFYWYQLLWVALSSIIVAVVFTMTRP